VKPAKVSVLFVSSSELIAPTPPNPQVLKSKNHRVALDLMLTSKVCALDPFLILMNPESKPLMVELMS
jgi:hypothetical protein